jgi:hypothetical protein
MLFGEQVTAENVKLPDSTPSNYRGMVDMCTAKEDSDAANFVNLRILVEMLDKEINEGFDFEQNAGDQDESLVEDNPSDQFPGDIASAINNLSDRLGSIRNIPKLKTFLALDSGT